MKITKVASTYNPEHIKVGIVHIGLGAFVRAHLAVYTEKVLNESGGNWGICAVNIRSNQKIVQALQAQNCQYTIAEYASSEDVVLREINSIREVMFAANGESKKLIARLQDEAIKIVSLTVTEKGYFLNPSDRKLKFNDESVQHDLKNPDTPKTAIGILVAALKLRFENNLSAFTILSCDNMPNNGESTKSAVLQFSEKLSPALSAWIKNTVSFPSCMVDRIVPAVTDESLSTVNELMAKNNASYKNDHTAIACESFTQWVIEDDFPEGRPDWQNAGASIVNNVAPYEDMKLRLLNGSHSLLAYLGVLASLETVSDCMSQPDFIALIKQYMLHEAIPTLEMPEGENLSEYVDSLVKRFSNDSLRHKTVQIAMDGSQKIPQRWLMGADLLLQREGFPKVTALGVAAWMRYVAGVSEQGELFEVSDPMASELKGICNENSNTESRVNALMQTQPFTHTSLAMHKEFVAHVISYSRELEAFGARKTVATFISNIRG